MKSSRMNGAAGVSTPPAHSQFQTEWGAPASRDSDWFAGLPELMRPSVLAEAISTTQQRLARERALKCGIPYVKWGSSIYYRRSDVAAFFASRVFTSTADAREAKPSRQAQADQAMAGA